MYKIRTIALLAGGLLVTHAASAPAARRTDAPPQSQYQYPSQTRDDFRPRVTDRQVQQILSRIRTDAETLRRQVAPAPDYGGAARYNPRRDDDVSYLIDDLLQATDHLADHLTRRVVTRADVDDVLRRGTEIQSALAQQRLSQQRWPALQRDLDSLASAYSLQWDWRNPQYGPAESGGIYQRLTGTYELDAARSDDPRRAADQALRRMPASDRTRALRQIEDRLDPPDAISIDRQGQRVTIASSRAPQISFDVDGRPRSETGPRGGNMSTRATLYGDQLEITVTGSNGTDFNAIFEPLENGQGLRVTRRLFSDALSQPVEVRSVYRRTSDTPNWNVFDEWRGRTASGRTSSSSRSPYQPVIIPDDTRLTATLDQALNLGNVRQNDRITLTVRNAARQEFEGATIQGYVTTAPSRVTDRTQLTVDFDQIQLRDGRSAMFTGVVEAVRGPDGRPISFNGETVAKDDSRQTQQAIQRGAIGAAIGALIGAVAGGGKGAAVGAVIGGGGAAATVFIDDANQRTLPVGTEFTIRARPN